MPGINRDVVVALALLVGCGAFWFASFEIKQVNYGSMQSSVWPQVILAALTVACLALLAQAVLRGSTGGETPDDGRRGIAGWLLRYRNALIVYGLFLVFLLTLEFLGMLLGGILFVFAALTILGRPELGRVPVHLAVAVGTVGTMWAIFTFALRVFLPSGEILPF